MKKQRKPLVGLTLMVLVCFLTATASYSLGDNVTKLLKLFGIGYVVQQFGGDINKFINTVTLRHNASTEQTTKVVPIVSIGSGGYIGAAQVTGAVEKVQKIKAVAQGELNIDSGDIRLRGLIPITTTKATIGIKGVSGVGVTAIIDFHL